MKVMLKYLEETAVLDEIQGGGFALYIHLVLICRSQKCMSISMVMSYNKCKGKEFLVKEVKICLYY